MKNFVKEFKQFIATGNMIELAVAVILGAAIKAVIDSFTTGVVMQLVAAIGGKPDFSALTFTINDAPIAYGAVITQIINLLVVGLVLFLMIRAYNGLKRKQDVAVEETPSAPPMPTEIELLAEIRDALKARG